MKLSEVYTSTWRATNHRPQPSMAILQPSPPRSWVAMPRALKDAPHKPRFCLRVAGILRPISAFPERLDIDARTPNLSGSVLARP